MLLIAGVALVEATMPFQVDLQKGSSLVSI